MKTPSTSQVPLQLESKELLIQEIEQLRLEKQQLEATIRQQQADITYGEQRWTFALEGIGDVIWEHNLQTGDVFRSALYRDMLGYTIEEFPNTFQAWKDLLHPQDRRTYG